MFVQDLNSLFGITKLRMRTALLDTPMPTDDHWDVFTELYNRLEALYSSTLAIPRAIELREPTENVFTSRDPVCGQVFELTSVTPLNCKVHQLVQYVWSHLTSADPCDTNGHRFEKVRILSIPHTPEHRNGWKRGRAR